MRVAPDRLLDILDSLGYRVAIYDREWRCTYVNAAAAGVLGQPAEALLGRSVATLVPESIDDPYHRELREAVATGLPVHGDHFDATRQRWLQRHVYPLPDGLMVLSRDVTGERDAERAAGEREQMLRLAQRAGGVATFEWDFANLTARCSSEFFRIFGLPAHDGTMAASDWQTFVHPDDREMMGAHLARVLDGVEAAAADYRITTADGRLRWLSYSGQLLQTPSGARLLGTVVDITDRRTAEDALRRSEERLQLTLDAARMVAWDWDLTTGRTTLSPSAPSVLGFTDGSWMEDEHGLTRLLPGDRARHEALVGQAIAAGEPWVSEVRFVRPSDRAVIWLEDRGKVIRDERGAVVSASGVLIDVTARKKAEDALRHSSEVLSLAMRGGAMGAWSRDLATDEVWWSPELEEIAGLAPGSFGQTLDAFVELVHEEDREALRAAVGSAIAHGTDYVVDFRIRHGGGEWRWMEGRGRATYGSDGAPHTLYGIGIDVTDRKRAEAALEAARDAAEAANRLKDHFLANLSHELRTPLNAILGYTRLLQTGVIAPERWQQAIAVIERNAVAQTQLVGELLDMSRITTGTVHLDPAPILAATVVRLAVDAVRPAAEAKGIEVAVDLDPFAGTVTADATRLQQVFGNLLNNAVKFTAAGGRIDVRLSRTDGLVEFAISDTGIGIGPEFLPYVFVPFRQADARFGRQYGGLGLGLAICKQLVELHGGTIEGTSRGSGQGATFVVRLPSQDAGSTIEARDEADRATEVPVAAARGSRAALAGVTVLVVDDEPDSLLLFRTTLEAHGAEVRPASTAADALALIEAWRPDLLVSDIGLPGMDGYELLRSLRERTGGWPPAAVAVTAYARPDDRARALAAGFHAHVAKPVDPSELVRTLAATLAATGRH